MIHAARQPSGGFSVKGAMLMGEIVLRPMTDADQAAMVAILRDERVSATFMLPDFPDNTAAARLFRRLMGMSQGTELYVRGAYDGERLVGFINQVEQDEGVVEVGYVIAPDCWNRGCATQMLRAAIGELFAMGYKAVRAGYFEGNDASGRVMEKCGMRLCAEEDEIVYRGKTRRCLYRIIGNA